MFTFKGQLEVQAVKEHSRKCLAFFKERVMENSEDFLLDAYTRCWCKHKLADSRHNNDFALTPFMKLSKHLLYPWLHNSSFTNRSMFVTRHSKIYHNLSTTCSKIKKVEFKAYRPFRTRQLMEAGRNLHTVHKYREEFNTVNILQDKGVTLGTKTRDKADK